MSSVITESGAAGVGRGTRESLQRQKKKERRRNRPIRLKQGLIIADVSPNEGPFCCNLYMIL